MADILSLFLRPTNKNSKLSNSNGVHLIKQLSFGKFIWSALLIYQYQLVAPVFTKLQDVLILDFAKY